MLYHEEVGRGADTPCSGLRGFPVCVQYIHRSLSGADPWGDFPRVFPFGT
ncbi:MAG: hypothetical protein KO463_08810 [Candidatus Methanofastidiosa archaeon]|nr:hypothetical protein [Candidatus Methanofastidiosa archaeon]